uniref:Interleukin 19 like n=1 Tax=Labrus bergylta TaxID=56723 RepID=A0A3Q3FC81_9LABR
MLLGCSLCLLVLLGWMSGYVESGTLHLDSCSVSVHTHELRKYYSAIRTNAIEENMTSICLSLQEGQTCCFLRLVLRFYVERVFSNYVSSQPTQQRSTSALANAFVSIRRDIHKCHCQCAEETQKTIDSLHAEFDKVCLIIKAAP